ncbi:MAG: helix-turn-helix domain-containing protein [Lewinellaceae bacterium]|nr:helix-turn-helix domain-containing protein [Lewinellaceae bacterium]
MSKKIPTYSICNLMGTDQCVAEFNVLRLSEYREMHPDLKFPHRHSFYQIALLTEGGGEHSIDFNTYPAREHQVYYMAPGQIHTWNFTPETDGYIVNFNESFFTAICHNPNFVNDFPLFNTISGQPVNVLETECCSEIHGLLERMLLEYQSDSDYKQDYLRALLLQLLVMLSRNMPTKTTSPISRHQITVLRNFERLIEQFYREKRLPRDYAEMLYITPNHLNALTNSVVGKPAGELIRDRVILEAKRLLVNSDYTIAQIADMLAFEDNAYFTRFFKKYTSMAPEIFRQEYQNDLVVS